MQPNYQQDLLQKLQHQEQMLKEKLQSGEIKASSLLNNVEDEFIVTEPISSEQQNAQVDVKLSNTAPDIKQVEKSVDSLLESVASIDITTPIRTRPTAPTSATPYHDEYGEETFYVKNVTNGHVVIPGIGIDAIPKGEIIDLLEYTDLQTLKSSHFLRKALSPNSGRVLLQRLTVEQYRKEKQLKDLTEAKLEQLRKQQYIEKVKSQTNTQVASIRPVILAKIEKLALSSRAETKDQGITSLEFIQWMESETFTMDELDHILGSVQDKDIKMYTIQRKQLL